MRLSGRHEGQWQPLGWARLSEEMDKILTATWPALGKQVMGREACVTKWARKANAVEITWR